MIEERIKHLVVALRVINLDVEKALATSSQRVFAGLMSNSYQLRREADNADELLKEIVPIRDSIEARLKWLLAQQEEVK